MRVRSSCLPSRITLTRTDPVLGLPRLRAAGDLADLRADELAFTLAEAREFLVERNRVDLEAGEVELLQDRTEGWPLAIRLLLRADSVAIEHPKDYVLTATLSGEKLDPFRHELKVDVQAISFPLFKVSKNAAGWKATIAFDI